MSCRRFEGQVVLVTGASRGIGAAAAIRFAEEGADVFLCCKERTDLADAVASRIHTMGRQAYVFATDLTDAKGAKKLIAAFSERFDRLDVLVPAAGHQEVLSLEDMDEATWQRSFAIHLDAVLETCQAAYPRLQKTGGRIVLISSVGARAAFPGLASVGSAKAGLQSLMRYMASEWIKTGVRVNAVACGTVDSGILERWESGPAVRAFVQKRTVGLGAARPEDIAPVIAFLAAPESRIMVGTIVDADGGMTLGIDFEEWVEAAYGKQARKSDASA